MSNICTYCGDPITPTEKSGIGPNGKVHYRCVKRGKSTVDAALIECQACHVIAFSPLFRYCLKCKVVAQ